MVFFPFRSNAFPEKSGKEPGPCDVTIPSSPRLSTVSVSCVALLSPHVSISVRLAICDRGSCRAQWDVGRQQCCLCQCSAVAGDERVAHCLPPRACHIHMATNTHCSCQCTNDCSHKAMCGGWEGVDLCVHVHACALGRLQLTLTHTLLYRRGRGEEKRQEEKGERQEKDRLGGIRREFFC